MTLNEILALAVTVKNETGIDKNTAIRVGTALEEIIKYFRDNSSGSSDGGALTTIAAMDGAAVGKFYGFQFEDNHPELGVDHGALFCSRAGVGDAVAQLVIVYSLGTMKIYLRGGEPNNFGPFNQISGGGGTGGDETDPYFTAWLATSPLAAYVKESDIVGDAATKTVRQAEAAGVSDLAQLANLANVANKAIKDEYERNIVSTYQTKTDNGLETVVKTIVAAINEVNALSLTANQRITAHSISNSETFAAVNALISGKYPIPTQTGYTISGSDTTLLSLIKMGYPIFNITISGLNGEQSNAVDLAGLFFKNVTFDNYNGDGMTDVDMTGTVFESCTFSNYGYMSYTYFTNTVFFNCTFQGISFQETSLINVSFESCDFGDLHLNANIESVFGVSGLYPYPFPTGRVKWVDGIWYNWDSINTFWIPESNGSYY